MRLVAILSAVAATGCSQILGVNDVTMGDGGVAPPSGPRLIAPQSTSIVTQQKPTLRWALDGIDGAPEVDLCRDRACTQPLPIATQLAGDHLSAAPASPLPAGWVYWRVRLVSGTQTQTSATWQFWVGATSARGGIDTSNAAILDVNGDGFPDLLIGAFGASAGSGTVHVYLGSASASAGDWNAIASARRIDLTSPDGSAASFGYAVASAGDVNGDGFADFVVGAFGVNHDAGMIHVYLGSATPSAADWNGATAARRIDVPGPDGADAIFGASVAAVGDVNLDGYADIVVGAAKASLAHVYLGSATPSAADWVKNPSPHRLDLVDPDMMSAFGTAVASAGDVNGDGFSDFLIGADGANAAAGAAHLYLGSAMPTERAWNQVSATVRLDLRNPDGPGASFGSALTSAGDVDGDGFADFLVAARTATGDAGAAHLYLGSANPNAVEWNTATRRVDLLDPDGNDALFGSAVASAGDVNGDGFADFVIGAAGASTHAGAAHVYLGGGVPDAAAWNGVAAIGRIDLVNPDGAGARFGASVASAGDVNGDGFVDFVVGADEANALAGASQLYLGSATPSAVAWSSTARIDLVNPAGASARFGVSVASAAP
ncbi:MAG TPA: VCBS repeat-containing protein, partial [Kofleriaceae bacterium]